MNKTAKETVRDIMDAWQADNVDTVLTNRMCDRLREQLSAVLDDTVTIAGSRYLGIYEDSLTLRSLEYGGVDNWEGYGEHPSFLRIDARVRAEARQQGISYADYTEYDDDDDDDDDEDINDDGINDNDDDDEKRIFPTRCSNV